MLVTKKIKELSADQEHNSLLNIIVNLNTVEVKAIVAYSEFHNNLPLEILLDTPYIQWWGVKPEDYWKHTYITCPIMGVDETGMKPTQIFLNRLRFNPWTSKGKCPAQGGYSEEDTFKIFLSMGNSFTVENTAKLIFSTVEEAILNYWQLRNSYGNTPLLFNPKKKQFLIGKRGGVCLFTSFEVIKNFFYGDENPDDCESLNNQIVFKRQEIVEMIQAMPGGKSF
jgi:hypothetical protein